MAFRSNDSKRDWTTEDARPATIHELCSFLGVSVPFYYSNRNEMPRAVKLGRITRFTPESVKAWLAARTHA